MTFAPAAKADEVVALLKAVNDGALVPLVRLRNSSSVATAHLPRAQSTSPKGRARLARPQPWSPADSAVEAVRKSDDSLSYEQAFAATALNDNPELYEEYLTGKGR